MPLHRVKNGEDPYSSFGREHSDRNYVACSRR